MLRVAILATLCTTFLCGCGYYYRSGDQPADLNSGVVELGKSGYKLNQAENLDTGMLMPDGRGGYIQVPGAPRAPLSPDMADAQELRLKVKELAAQLFENRPNAMLAGLVALPTSFVNLNDFNDTSPFGRYLAEAMYHEFNQRGFPVREYRLNGKIRMATEEGEFALTRAISALSVKQSYSTVLVGTYLKNNNTYFVNARLVRPTDGRVLRTAQLILGGNELLASMTLKPPFVFREGTMRIVAPKNSVRSKGQSGG